MVSLFSLLVFFNSSHRYKRACNQYYSIFSFRNGLVWIPTTVILIFYALYLVECLHCTIHRDLINIVTPENAQRLLHRWINAKPIIRWRAICYHYGRNIRQRYAGSSKSCQSQLWAQTEYDSQRTAFVWIVEMEKMQR